VGPTRELQGWDREDEGDLEAWGSSWEHPGNVFIPREEQVVKGQIDTTVLTPGDSKGPLVDGPEFTPEASWVFLDEGLGFQRSDSGWHV
jgi:hypothetical protein